MKKVIPWSMAQHFGTRLTAQVRSRIDHPDLKKTLWRYLRKYWRQIGVFIEVTLNQGPVL